MAASSVTTTVGRATASSAVTMPPSALGPVAPASPRPGRPVSKVSSSKEVQRVGDEALDQMHDGVAGDDLVEHAAESARRHGADGVLGRRHAVVTAAVPPSQES